MGVIKNANEAEKGFNIIQNEAGMALIIQKSMLKNLLKMAVILRFKFYR